MRPAWGAFAGAVALNAVAALAAGQSAPRAAVPLEPVGAIVAALQSHQAVALPGKAGTHENASLILSVIRDPRFVRLADDVVVEFGNARYQDLVDRYVRGETIEDAALQRVWRDHTEPGGSFDGPLTIEVFRAVRAVNAGQPAGRRLRILLADPPIDWTHITSPADHRKWIVRRDSFAADVVRSEVLARGRRALLLFGNGHLPRKEILTNYDMTHWQAQTLTSLIERTGDVRMFVVFGEGAALQEGTIQADTRRWPDHAMALVRGTTLGAADFAAFNPVETRYVIRATDDFAPLPRSEWRTVRLEEQVDAILKLPARPTPAAALPGLCTEPGYVAMRLARLSAAGGPAGLADWITRTCK